MSTHAVNIITIEEVRPHPNAERLEIVPVGGWQAVTKKGQFRVSERAVYIEPDYQVPTDREEFAFLAKAGREHHRLKAVRLRGELSYGLLIPVPAELKSFAVGTNVMADLGISRWEPEVKLTMADELPQEQWPAVFAPKFDIESYEKFPHVIADGEPVVITEKVHGANARYVFVDGVFHQGSRQRWLIPDGGHIWARAAAFHAGIRQWCEANPGTVLYGEVYGNVQSLTYGLGKGEVRFIAFAAARAGQWINQPELFDGLASYGVVRVPILYQGPFDHAEVKAIAERDSVVAMAPGHMIEGVVVVPEKERFHGSIGRVAVKHISNRYWVSGE
jgi:RNA ligase (TIGR02306 family)